VSKKCGHGEADYLVFVDGVAVESSKTRARRYDADEFPLGSERGLSGSETGRVSWKVSWGALKIRFVILGDDGDFGHAQLPPTTWARMVSSIG